MDTSTESQKAGRKRNPKFSTMELQTLVEEVVRVHTQLYGRQSLTVPESTKRRLWLDIGEKVNAVGVTHRSLDDLKKRFYDIRGVTKRKLADLHKQAGLTGGGTNRAPPLTQLEELVATTIERASVVGIGDLDSSSRATATGAPSGGGAASAPAPTASAAVASTSAAAQEEEDNSCALANEEDTGHSLTTPHSPRLSQSQSPSLVFSPDNTPPQSHPAPATSPARRRIVAPLVIMEGAAGQAPAQDPVTPATPEHTQQGSRIPRRPRATSSPIPAPGGSVFAGLETSMVTIQRMQAKSILACHRQLRLHNLQMGEMTQGFKTFVDSNKDIATSIGRMTTAITQLCTRLDDHELSRRRDARVTNRSLTRLAAATAQSCQRGANMEASLTQSMSEVTRGMGRVPPTNTRGNAGKSSRPYKLAVQPAKRKKNAANTANTKPKPKPENFNKGSLTSSPDVIETVNTTHKLLLV
ncbi:uncharacterized protein LOC144761466 [Lissotriton helveticus]